VLTCVEQHDLFLIINNSKKTIYKLYSLPCTAVIQKLIPNPPKIDLKNIFSNKRNIYQQHQVNVKMKHWVMMVRLLFGQKHIQHNLQHQAMQEMMELST
jgi:hypothetical protein